MKYLITSRPDIANSQCLYSVNSIAVNKDDGTETAGTERTERVAIPYQVPAGSKTCTFDPGPLFIGYSNAAPQAVSPTAIGSAQFNPPLKDTEYAALDNNTTFIRDKTCDATKYGTCMAPEIIKSLVLQFNSRYAQGTDSAGNPFYSLFMNTPTGGKTPLMSGVNGLDKYKPGISDPAACVYKASFTVDKGDGTGNKVNITQNITFTLTPTTGTTDPIANKCGYTLSTHDYPTSFYPAPIPKSGIFAIPQVSAPLKGVLGPRTSCTDAAIQTRVNNTALASADAATLRARYSDCSGTEVIDRIISQFNLQRSDRKILRVVKAFTPQTPALTCDYEVDIQRSVGGKSVVERDTVRIKVQEPPAADPEKCLWDLASDSSDKRQSGVFIDRDSVSQTLSNDYIWPLNYVTSVRNSLNNFIAAFIPINVNGNVDAAVASTKVKLNKLSQDIISGQVIKGCPVAATGQPPVPGSTCRDPATLTAFMNRYAYDCQPPYPSGQFGSTVRSIIGWRKAGLSGPLECHLELIEREETFANWLVKRKDVKDNTAPETARFYLRQYAFTIDSAAGYPNNTAGNPCVIVPHRFTSAEIEKRSFDISGNPYGILAPSAAFASTDLQNFSFTTPTIDPTSTAVLNAMRVAVAKYKPKAPGYASQTLTAVSQYMLARPNVIEYKVQIQETINDIDFGTVQNNNIDAIVVVQWPETDWNPVTGTFAATPPPAPTAPNVLVFVPGRASFVNQQVVFDGDTYAYPPYLFWPTPDYDPTTYELRVKDFLVSPRSDAVGQWTYKDSPNGKTVAWTRP
jgi:hypothetical protein